MCVIPPSAILSRKGIARYHAWGGSHWAAKQVTRSFLWLVLEVYEHMLARMQKEQAGMASACHSIVLVKAT